MYLRIQGSYLSEIVGSGDEGREGRGRRRRRSLGRMCTVMGTIVRQERRKEICWHEMYWKEAVEIHMVIKN